MKKVKLGDIVIISVILLITAGVFCFRLFGFESGERVVVSIDGKETEYLLDENRTVNIENGGVKLCVVIENGEVVVTDSNCPEQSCVHMGKISDTGESIACIPARLFVKITGEGEADYDYIVG